MWIRRVAGSIQFIGKTPARFSVVPAMSIHVDRDALLAPRLSALMAARAGAIVASQRHTFRACSRHLDLVRRTLVAAPIAAIDRGGGKS